MTITERAALEGLRSRALYLLSTSVRERSRKMQEKRILLEGDNILIQWGEAKAVISLSSGAVAVDALGLDSLIAALLLARGQMAKRERATLYARVPHSLKSEFLRKAQEQGLTQNAAIIAAVQQFMGYTIKGERGNDLARP